VIKSNFIAVDLLLQVYI